MAVDDANARTPEPRDEHRASDADRQRVADQLREALDEGRLTLLEYDERLGSAYGAKTYGELAAVTRDLPATGSATVPVSAPAGAGPTDRPRWTRKGYLAQQGGGWLGGSVVTNGIWAFSTGADLHHYWPGPVMLIWGVGIVARLIKGEPRRHEPPPSPERADGLSDRYGHLARLERREEQARERRRQRPGRRADPAPTEPPDRP